MALPPACAGCGAEGLGAVPVAAASPGRIRLALPPGVPIGLPAAMPPCHWPSSSGAPRSRGRESGPAPAQVRRRAAADRAAGGRRGRSLASRPAPAASCSCPCRSTPNGPGAAATIRRFCLRARSSRAAGAALAGGAGADAAIRRRSSTWAVGPDAPTWPAPSRSAGPRAGRARPRPVDRAGRRRGDHGIDSAWPAPRPCIGAGAVAVSAVTVARER